MCKKEEESKCLVDSVSYDKDSRTIQLSLNQNNINEELSRAADKLLEDLENITTDELLAELEKCQPGPLSELFEAGFTIPGLEYNDNLSLNEINIKKGKKKMKIYIHDDHMEQGNVYMKHLSAMTKEQLHSKADIAGELAGRDIVINKLTKFLEDVVKIIDFPSDSDLLNNSQHELIDLFNKIQKFFNEQDLTIYKADSLEYDE